MENKSIMSESPIEKRLVTEVERVGGWCLKLPNAGLPDRLCLFPGGEVVFVELKAFGKKPRKLQILMHQKLKAIGFRVEVIDTTMGCKMLALEYDRK